MPVLLSLEKNSVRWSPVGLAPVSRLVREPLRLPAWAVVAAILVVGVSAFAAGRRRPAHHYVSYFGYPMVLDTTTGRACYSAPPRPSDSAPVQDAAFTPDSSGDGVSGAAPAGPSIPLCGSE